MNFSDWQKGNWDAYSKEMDCAFVFDKEKLQLRVISENEFPMFNNAIPVALDMFGNKRTRSVAGPIKELQQGDLIFNLK